MSKIFKSKKRSQPQSQVLQPLTGYGGGDPFASVMGGYGQSYGGGGYNPFALAAGGYNPFAGGGYMPPGGGYGGMGGYNVPQGGGLGSYGGSYGDGGGYGGPFGAGGGMINPYGGGMGGYGTSFGGVPMGGPSADPNTMMGQYFGQMYYGGGAFNPFDPSGMGGGWQRFMGQRGGMGGQPQPQPQPQQPEQLDIEMPRRPLRQDLFDQENMLPAPQPVSALPLPTPSGPSAQPYSPAAPPPAPVAPPPAPVAPPPAPYPFIESTMPTGGSQPVSPQVPPDGMMVNPAYGQVGQNPYAQQDVANVGAMLGALPPGSLTPSFVDGYTGPFGQMSHNIGLDRFDRV